MFHTTQKTEPFAVATLVMCGRPAAVAASFGVSTTSATAARQPRITKAATANGCVYLGGYNVFLFRKFIWFPHLSIFWIYPVSGFIRFLDFSPDISGFFSEFSSNLQISSQNGWFTANKLYDHFLSLKFFRFPDFYQIFKFILFLSLLYSRSRTLRI